MQTIALDHERRSITRRTATMTTKRVPRDEFEAALFRRVIRSEVEAWTNVLASIGETFGADGALALTVSQGYDERPFRFGSELTRPYREGSVWIADADGEPVVWWEIAGMANHGTAPFIDW